MSGIAEGNPAWDDLIYYLRRIATALEALADPMEDD
jgi:hypothetical protein